MNKKSHNELLHKYVNAAIETNKIFPPDISENKEFCIKIAV